MMTPIDDKVENDVTGDEPEVTREMIDAGMDALLKYDSRFDDLDEAVIQIWRAMKNAAPKI